MSAGTATAAITASRSWVAKVESPNTSGREIKESAAPVTADMINAEATARELGKLSLEEAL